MVIVEKRYHRDLVKDMKRLDGRERVIVLNKIDAVANGSVRGAALSGTVDCFKLRIADLQLVYLIRGDEIWFLIIDRRGRVYEEFARRYLQVLRGLENK